jgi:hypothetical protein
MITESLPKKYSVSSYYYLGARQRCHNQQQTDATTTGTMIDYCCILYSYFYQLIHHMIEQSIGGYTLQELNCANSNG